SRPLSRARPTRRGPNKFVGGSPGTAGLILVRHAPTAWSGHRYCGRSDPPLDGPGLAAAARLASGLAPTLPAGIRIVASPRRRALETATAIANAAGLVAVIVDDRW